MTTHAAAIITLFLPSSRSHTSSCPAEDRIVMDCEPNLVLKSPPLSPSPKRSRRSVQKRVVSLPIPAAGEVAPSLADTWAWRKYGQKPIKGSPYPRGYYRCSSSKGCPARKQVERSRADPTMLTVTYSCEHNHPWPLPKKQAAATANAEEADADPGAEPLADPDPITLSPKPDSVAADLEESRFPDLIGQDSGALMIPDAFWYSDVGSASSTSRDTLLYGPIFAGSADLAAVGSESIGDVKDDGEEDALFAGLGELPEYSTVFRRSYLERQMALRTAVRQ